MFAGIVYLFILIVKALKKYINSKEVREEKKAVSKWENGSSDPNTPNLIALAKLYKISPEELLECATGTSKGGNDTEFLKFM